MKHIDIKMVPIDVGDLRDVLRGDRLIIEHKGNPKFALISLHDLNLLESMQMEDLQESEDEFDLNSIEM